MDGFLLDARSAWRAAWRRPALTGLTILTLVLGIGANTAIFAVARGVATPEMLREFRARATSLVDTAAVELWRGNLSSQVDLVTNDGAERLRGSFATPNFFPWWGSAPSWAGRLPPATAARPSS